MTTQAHQVLEERTAELIRKRNENALLRRQIDELGESMVKITEELGVGQEALSFLEELANSRRGAMKGRIESVITEALHLIYDDSYRAELSYSVKNNRSNLIIEMVRETKAGDVRRQMGGFGGGVADTMSVPLRLMVLMGSRQTERICVLDECWKHMDPERIPLIGNFIRVLTDRLGIQVIFATHHHPLQKYSDKTFEISEKSGISAVQILG